MNIQLRDCKPIQDIVKRERIGKAMPMKPQLHPDLLNGMCDADREGFDIRSEIMYGDHKGQPNAQDMINLKAFLPQPAECEARWKVVTIKDGESFRSIPQELIFTFPDSSKIVLITQAVPDITKLTNALPSDQSARFTATPNETGISFKRVGVALPQPVIGPTIIANLKTQAAILGVPWDNAASVESMVERIDAAQAEKAKATAPATPAKKKDLQPA